MTAGWGVLVYTGSIDTIWPMFGIANQLLGRGGPGAGDDAAGQHRPRPLRLGDAVADAVRHRDDDDGGVSRCVGCSFPAMIRSGQVLKGALSMAMTIFVVACVGTLLLLAVSRWLLVARGIIGVRPEEKPPVLGDLALSRR